MDIMLTKDNTLTFQ